MLPKLLFYCLGLASVRLAKAVADCEWYSDVNACIPVLEDASDVGDKYTQLTLELIVCLENNDEAFTGCRRGDPVYFELCSNVSVSDGDVGNNMCLPKSGNLTFLSFSQAREMKSYVSCIGKASQDCEQVRGGLYSFLGCAACGDLANAAALVEGACTQVFGTDGSEALCAAAGDAAPTADARAVANATGVLLRAPAGSDGVNVPLLGGAPSVGAAAGGPEAAAPATAAAAQPDDAAASAPTPAGASEDDESEPLPGGAVQQDASRGAACVASWVTMLAAACAAAAALLPLQ